MDQQNDLAARYPAMQRKALEDAYEAAKSEAVDFHDHWHSVLNLAIAAGVDKDIIRHEREEFRQLWARYEEWARELEYLWEEE